MYLESNLNGEDRFSYAPLGARIRSVRGNSSRESWRVRYGVGTSTLQRFETGERCADLQFLERVSDGEGVSFEWLALGRGERSPHPRAADAFDRKALGEALATVEEGLQKAGRSLAPDKKAELVLVVYDVLRSGNVDRGNVLRLVMAAA